MCPPSSASAVTAEAFSPGARLRLEANSITRVRRSPLTLKLIVCAGGKGSAFWVTDSTATPRVELGRVKSTSAGAAALLLRERNGPAIAIARASAASARKGARVLTGAEAQRS